MASDRAPTLARVAAIVLAALLAPAVATAAEPSPADKETARNLLREGDDKLAARDFAGALKAYAAAHAIMHLPTTGLSLAKAQIGRGLFVEASDTLLEVSRYPADPAEKPAFTQAREEAAQLAEKLAPRIPGIVLTVEGAPAGAALEVSIDGVVIPNETLGTPRKINPGPHRIVVSSPGFEPVTRNVASREGDTRKVALQLKRGAGGGGPPARFNLGFAAAPSMSLFLDGGSPMYGGTASFVFQVAITPMFDLRTGLTAGVLHRGDDDISQLAVVVPVSIRLNYTPWFSFAAGLSAGFGTTFLDGQTGAAVGPEWSLLSMYAGDKRQFELSFTQGLRFGNVPAEYHQSFVFTYLARD